MTSKNLFFKLMREDLKRRIWALGLAFLSFFFGMPVAAAMGASSISQSYQRWVAEGATFYGGTVSPEVERYNRMTELAEQIVGIHNVFIVCIIMAAAVVLGLTGFMYLHSKKQVDFYNSLPVRRELLYAVKYIDGILMILFMYLLNLLFAVGVFLANGLPLSVFLTGSLAAFAVHMTGFLLIYGLTTIAVLLTGNFFVSILGGIVLHSLIPSLVLTVYVLMSLFFMTINYRGTDVLQRIAVNGSPFSYYISLVGDGMGLSLIPAIPAVERGMALISAVPAAGMGSLAGRMAAGLLAAVLMAVLGLFLYRFRPSEAAGRAMAFSVTKAPIKIFIVVPVTILMGVFFWSIYSSLAWAAFGFLLGLLITHGIVEIIYHFDFRKLLAHPVHIGICAVLALAGIGLFRYDLFGYDRYIPSEQEFVSASISCRGLHDWIDYGLPRVEDGSYSWQYMNEDDYVAANMGLTDYALVKAFAQQGIANAAKEKDARMKNLWNWDQGDGYWVSAEVGYERKDGSRAYRSYSVNLTALGETMDSIYESAEYKSGVYPVLHYTKEDVTGLYEAKANEIRQVPADGGLLAEILEAYQKELTALTLTERSETTPVTSLRFLTTGEREYLHAISMDRASGFTGDFRLEDMNQVNFFPVYPSFTETIRLLKEAGIDVYEGIPAEDVSRIEIHTPYYAASYEDPAVQRTARIENGDVIYIEYSSDTNESVAILENDGSSGQADRIQEVLDSIVPEDMVHLNQLQLFDNGLEVWVFRNSRNAEALPSEEVYTVYYFDGLHIPDFVKEAVGYEESGWNGTNISYGLQWE